MTSRRHLNAPPQPGDPDYDRAIRQVRSKGIAPQLSGTLPAELLPSRAPTETSIGFFWGYDGAKGLGTPPRLYNQIIREHDASVGPTGVGVDVLDLDADPGWLPLGAQKTNNVGMKNFTPNFPAYPSGHATFGAAVFQSVRQFYRQGNHYGPDTLASQVICWSCRRRY